MTKKVAIIGGGFTGLACGVDLVDKGINITIFEAGEKCGGFATGFRPDSRQDSHWRWSLEIFYHHIFTGDKSIRDLAKRVGCLGFFKKPLTTSFFHLKEIQLDSPISLLRFSEISLWGRIRMGLGLAILKIIPQGMFLERYTVTKTLPSLIGVEGYRTIWEKLLRAKFGPYVDRVNMAWFWARVAKRSQALGYFEGGFQELANKSVEYIEKRGGKIELGKKVTSITRWIPDQVRDDEKEKVWSTKPGQDRDGKNLVRQEGCCGVVVDGERFDAVVITIPASSLKKIIPKIEFPVLDYLSAQTLVLETSVRLMRGYWMNILEDKWPFLVMVDHTNFIDKKNYGGSRIVYLGNYLPEGHPQLKMTKEELLKLYSPFIKKVYRKFNKAMVKNMYLFREPYAQPVFPKNYSKNIPSVRSSIEGVYLANMSMVYPFDRGTNYAVKMGEDVAKMIIKDLNKDD